MDIHQDLNSKFESHVHEILPHSNVSMACEHVTINSNLSNSVESEKVILEPSLSSPKSLSSESSAIATIGNLHHASSMDISWQISGPVTTSMKTKSLREWKRLGWGKKNNIQCDASMSTSLW